MSAADRWHPVVSCSDGPAPPASHGEGTSPQSALSRRDHLRRMRHQL